jgi:predicted ABC-type ATPase
LSDQAPGIYVLAGVNGAGKSSIGGLTFNERGTDYFNPDAAARRFQQIDPSLTLTQANSLAWNQGKLLLERAIAERGNFTFETTLGGNTITDLLETASEQGLEVRVWYAGLSSPELHIARVRRRVQRGGHDIPESDIRRRYETSRLNLIRLMPKLTELRVYDNSFEADPERGQSTQIRLILQMAHGTIVGPEDLSQTPEWAKPIVAAALRLAVL